MDEQLFKLGRDHRGWPCITFADGVRATDIDEFLRVECAARPVHRIEDPLGDVVHVDYRIGWSVVCLTAAYWGVDLSAGSRWGGRAVLRIAQRLRRWTPTA